MRTRGARSGRRCGGSRTPAFAVEPFRPEGLEEARELWWEIFGRASRLLLEPLVAGREAEVHPNLVEFLDWTRRDPPLTALGLLQVEIARDMLKTRVLRQMERYPVLLCPVAPMPAFRHGEREWTIEGTRVHYLDAWRYTAWFNLLQNPGVSVPVTSSAEGLPIGVQVVARPWEELTALAVARVIEQARGPWTPPPAPGTIVPRHRLVTGMTRSPSLPLVVGLVVSLVTIAGMGWYTVREVRTLRDEQTAISERNRRDSLQLIRIQSNLATVATALRDMADRVEPYPVIYWRQTFDRLRADLDEAIALENTFCARRAARRRSSSGCASRWIVCGARSTRCSRRPPPATRTARWRASAPASARSTRSWSGWSRSSWCSTTACRRKPASATARSTSGSCARSSCWWPRCWCWSRSSACTPSGPTARRSRRSPGCRISCARSRGACCGSRKTCSSRFRASCTTTSARCSRPSARCWAASSATCRADSSLVGDVEEVLGIAQQTLERIRVQSRLLHPTVLDDFGLEKAVEWYVEQFGRQHDIATHFEVAGPIGVVPTESNIHIYRIVQEALTNVSKHAGAKEAWVRMAQHNGRLALAIEDRGRGLPAGDAVARGVGLVSMRERAELMGGTFAIRPATPRGVIVDVEVPLGLRAPRN